MRSLSLYVKRDSLIHKIDPVTKIIYVFVSVISPFILSTLIFSTSLTLINLLFLLLGRVVKKVIPIISFVFIIILTIFIIQGMFYDANQTELFSLFNLNFYVEGILYAARISVRAINVLLAFSLLILTTPPAEMIESLVRRGMPAKLGYIMHSVLQIIPMMSSNASIIMDAQRARGMETEGSLWVRIKAFIPLIGPLVMSSLVNTHERSIALEVRGFSAATQKTFLHQEKVPGGMKQLRIFFLLFLAAVLAWRLVL